MSTNSCARQTVPRGVAQIGLELTVSVNQRVKFSMKSALEPLPLPLLSRSLSVWKSTSRCRRFFRFDGWKICIFLYIRPIRRITFKQLESFRFEAINEQYFRYFGTSRNSNNAINSRNLLFARAWNRRLSILPPRPIFPTNFSLPLSLSLFLSILWMDKLDLSDEMYLNPTGRIYRPRSERGGEM